MTLASGTAIGQLLLFLAVPVLTRLYTPADYGALAVYSSTLTVLVVLASLRYEAAIPLPQDEDTAASLLALTFLLLAVTAAIVSLLVWLAGDAFVAVVKVPALRPYRWLLPVGFIGAGMYPALSYWAIRRGEFGRVARTKLSQGVGQVVSQVGLGAAGAGAPGLLIGDVIGRVAGGGGLALLALGGRSHARVTRASVLSAASRYRRFPLLTTWSGLLNVGSLQLPSILFSASFGAAAAGLYALSFKMLVLPTMLVGQAVGQVFLSRAAPLAGGTRACVSLPNEPRSRSLPADFLLFGALALAGPQLFAILMGDEWDAAGHYAQLLAPWFAVWLVSSPLSGLLSVREWQGSALIFSAFEFALRLGALLCHPRAGGTARGGDGPPRPLGSAARGDLVHAGADLLLVDQFESIMPSKLLQDLRASRPIIAFLDKGGEIREVLQAATVAHLVPRDEAEIAGPLVAALAAGPRRRGGSPGNAVTAYSRHEVARRFAAVLEAVCVGASPSPHPASR